MGGLPHEHYLFQFLRKKKTAETWLLLPIIKFGTYYFEIIISSQEVVRIIHRGL